MDTPAVQIEIEMVPDLHAGIVEIDEGLCACRGFPVLRETLFTELGIRSPRLTLSEDPSLPCQGFAFVMGGIRTPPFIGLPPDAMLAIDGHRRPADAVHPVSGSPAAIVPADALLDLTTDDLIGPVALVVMALARVARDHAASTVTATSTADELDLLRQIFPMLAEACRPHLYALTRIRRGLVEEGINVRDLRSVIQAVLDEKMRAGALSDEADLLRGVRLALRPMVTAAAAKGASFLTARRLPSDRWWLLTSRKCLCSPRTSWRLRPRSLGHPSHRQLDDISA